MANLIRAAVSQEMGDKQRQSANWEECKGSIATLQEDLQGICAAQVKMGHEIASLVTGLQDATEGLAEVRAHMAGQFWESIESMRGARGLPLATTGAAINPTKSDVASDVEGLLGVLTRVELLEETRDTWEDAMLTEAARRGDLAVSVDRLRKELDALRRDGVEMQRLQGEMQELQGVVHNFEAEIQWIAEGGDTKTQRLQAEVNGLWEELGLRSDGVQGQLHILDDLQGSIRAAIREGALSDAMGTMKDVMRQEISPILMRVQEVEVHVCTSTVKLDQRLAGLESGIVQAEGLDLVREGLAEVQQKMAGVWRTVYGSEVVRGEEVVLCGLAQNMLNGCQGVVREWNADRDRWVIEAGGKRLLIKAGNTFAKDGLVAKWAAFEQEQFSELAFGDG